jgi:DNA primase catalytic subunit
MTIDDVKKTIGEFIGNNEIRLTFLNQQSTEELKCLYEKILNDVSLLEKEEKLDDKEVIETSNRIKYINSIFLNNLYLNPITNEINSFIKSWSMLIYNWNQNTIKEKQIYNQGVLMPRIVDGHFTVLEAINNLKEISNYLSRVRGWLPPAIDISKHYFNILNKKDE